jgi:hypothetical protein
MPKTNRKLTRAVTERRDSTGETYTQAREGVLATLSLPQAERDKHAFAAAVRLRMAHAGEDEAAATRAVEVIQDTALGNGWTFAEAQAEYDDPRNEILCETCGWTVGMVCPECPGCGCYNSSCSGWRHEEFMDPHERAELERERNECPECGGDSTNEYECRCYEEGRIGVA